MMNLMFSNYASACSVVAFPTRSVDTGLGDLFTPRGMSVLYASKGGWCVVRLYEITTPVLARR